MGSKYEQINNLIEQIGWGPYNYTCFIVCGMNFSSIMLWGSCISIAIKVAGDDWSLSGYEEGLLGTSHTFGIFIGSYFWGYQSNYKGRLKSLKIIDMLSIFFSALFVLSLNYPMLIISIFFQGFCNGGAVVASVTLYSETIPQNKSWTMVLLSGFMVCGGCIAYAMALFISIGGYYQIALWRWVGAVAFILQIAFWAATYLIEESPKFLIRTSSDKETCQVLE